MRALAVLLALACGAWADCPDSFTEFCGDLEWCQGPDAHKAEAYCRAVNRCHAVRHPGYHASCDQLTEAEQGVQKAREELEKAKEDFAETPSPEAADKLDKSVGGHLGAIDKMNTAYDNHYSATKALEEDILKVDERYPACLDPGDCPPSAQPNRPQAASGAGKLEQIAQAKKQEGAGAVSAAKADQAKAAQAAQAYKTLLSSQQAGPDAQKSARQFIDGALKENPNNPSALRVRVIDAYQRGDCSSVAADAATILKKNPADKQMSQIAGLCHSGAPLPASLAKPSFDKSGTPGDPTGSAWMPAAPGRTASSAAAPPSGLPPAAQSAYMASQAAQALMMRDFQRARDYAVRSSELTAANPDAWRLRAMADGHLKDYKQAIKDADEGLKLYPRDKQLLNIKAFSQNKAKDCKGALVTADAALAADANDGAAWMNRAYALAGAGDRQGMLDALRKAAALDPRYAGALEAAMKIDPSLDPASLFLDDDGRAAAAPAKKGIPRAWLLAALAAGALFTLAGFYGVTRRSEPEPPAD